MSDRKGSWGSPIGLRDLEGSIGLLRDPLRFEGLEGFFGLRRDLKGSVGLMRDS